MEYKSRVNCGRWTPFNRMAMSISLWIMACLGAVLKTSLTVNASPFSSPYPQASGPTTIQETPAELRRIVRLATTAVNGRDAEALKPLAAPSALSTFAWIRERTTKTWSGDILYLPKKSPTGSEAVSNDKPESPTFFAVFHAWHTCQSDGDHIHRVIKTADGWQLGPEIPELETGGYRIRDHDLTVNIDFAKQGVSVHDIARMEVAGSNVQPYCLLRLAEDYAVGQFKVNGVPTRFHQAGGVVLFVPPASNEAKTVTIDMSYSGRVKHQGSDYVLAQEATINSYWYPTIARLPATATVTVTAPPGWAAISQGEKQKEVRNQDGSATVTYRNEIPTCWFTLDVGNYKVTQRTVNGRLLSTFLLSDNANRARSYLDLLAQAIAFYDKSFAPFPYTHYDIVETKGPFGGALEGYSMATFGPGTMPGTIAHELAHTWWGGIVPCSYTRSMWNEGFADYAQALFERSASSMSVNKTVGAGDNENVPVPGRRRVFGRQFDGGSLAEAHDTSDNAQGAVGYGKGSLVMRVLEEELGKATMIDCLQDFVKNHPKGEATEWDEFARAVQRVTGKDYGWFFAQWVGRRGLPALRFANLRLVPNGDRFTVEGDVVQTGEPYRIRLPLQLVLQNGKVMRETVEVDGAVRHFSLVARAMPTRITLDPDNVLPLATTTEEATVILR